MHISVIKKLLILLLCLGQLTSIANEINPKSEDNFIIPEYGTLEKLNLEDIVKKLEGEIEKDSYKITKFLDNDSIQLLKSYCSSKNAVWKKNPKRIEGFYGPKNYYIYECSSLNREEKYFLLSEIMFHPDSGKYRIITNDFSQWKKLLRFERLLEKKQLELKQEIKKQKLEEEKKKQQIALQKQEKEKRLALEKAKLDQEIQREENIKQQRRLSLRSRTGQQTMIFFDNWKYNGSMSICAKQCMDRTRNETGYSSLQEALDNKWQFVAKITEITFNPNTNCQCIGAQVLLKK